MSIKSTPSSLIAEADKCVLCGMCLPHCPTYSLSQTENESPRGRLMLGKALLNRQLELNDKLLGYIDHCLLCRSCERTCPSGVGFGAFMDGLRANLVTRSTAPGPTDEIIDIVSDQGKRRQFNQRLWLGQRTGVLGVGKLFLNPATNRMLNNLPRVHRFHIPQPYYAAHGKQTGEVMLFTGCSEELFGNTLTRTTIELLNALGLSVHIPAMQTCCGGLARHHGEQETADRLAMQNTAAFSHDATMPVLSIASGCGASLFDTEQGNHRVVDVSSFLFGHIQQHGARFSPLDRRIALHTPCSLKNVLRQDTAVSKLLALIPDLDIIELKSQRGCCGAAGTYMYEHPGVADQLREPLLQEITALKVDSLVTSNIGCAMHIKSGLSDNRLRLDVLHPVELLARQIMTDGS